MCAKVVERLHSTKGPHDLAHFFIVHSLGAIIQLVPEQLTDLLFSLDSLKTVILIYISVFLQCDIALLSNKTIWKIYIGVIYLPRMMILTFENCNFSLQEHFYYNINFFLLDKVNIIVNKC